MTQPHTSTEKKHQPEKQSKNINPMFSIKIGNYLKDIITEKFSKWGFCIANSTTYYNKGIFFFFLKKNETYKFRLLEL